VDVTNSTGGDTQIRPPGSTTTTGTKSIPIFPLQPAATAPVKAPAAPSAARPAPPKGWTHLAAGASLQIQVPPEGNSRIEFVLPNGQKLVEMVDAQTEKVELVQDRDGSYRVVLTPDPARPLAPPKPAAAGGRR